MDTTRGKEENMECNASKLCDKLTMKIYNWKINFEYIKLIKN
jgi:hypothetical protein